MKYLGWSLWRSIGLGCLAISLAACDGKFAANSELPSNEQNTGSTSFLVQGQAVSSSTFQNFSIPSQNGLFSLEFDAIPNGNDISAISSLSNGAASSGSPGDVVVRFNPSGTIDALNGASYSATSSVSYSAGNAYHFSIAVNVPKASYSVFVTPDGGLEQVLAENFAFSASIASLNTFAIQASSGSHEVFNVNISIPLNTDPPASAPAPSPAPAITSANGTTIPPATQIVDSSKSVYTVVNGQIAQNGTIDTRTHQVSLLLYYNGLIYQEATSQDLWFSTNGSAWPNSTWTQVSGDPRAVISPAPAPSPAPVPAPSPAPSSSGLTPPVQAAAAGFHTLVLNQGGSAGWNIDVNNTGQPGYTWYQNGFGITSAKPSNFSVSNGILTIVGGGNSGWTLATVESASNSKGYVGTAYGGGMYTEASISLDPSCVNTGTGSWPAFWSMAVEHFTHNDQWTGQPSGYEHFIELDFMEFWGSYYTFANIDWSGVYGQSCGFYCTVNNVPNNMATVPSSTNWTNYNVYGGMVVPSYLNGGNGYTQSYFNNATSAKPNNFSTYNPSAAPPASGGQIFAVTDVDHLPLIMGTTQNCPMKVSYVRVWQKP